MDALLEQQGRVRVPEVVKARTGEPSGADDPFPDTVKVRCIDVRTNGGSEDYAVVLVRGAELQPLLELVPAVSAEQGDCVRRERYRPSASMRLWWPVRDALAWEPRRRLPHVERCRLQVYITPTQAKEFALSHPREHGETHQRFVPRVSRRL